MMEGRIRMPESTQGKFSPGHKINCDQVAWLLAIFDRYLPKSNFPSISRKDQMMKYGMLYEVMEIVGLAFEDDMARSNGTPRDARPE